MSLTLTNFSFFGRKHIALRIEKLIRFIRWWRARNLWVRNIGALHRVYHDSTLPRPPAREVARQAVSRARCVFVLVQFIETGQQ